MVPVFNFHLDLRRHQQIRHFADGGRLVMDSSDVHIVATAVVLGAVATTCLASASIAYGHTTEEKFRRIEYGAFCTSCSRSAT